YLKDMQMDSHVIQDKLVDYILTEDNQKVDTVVEDSNLLEVDMQLVVDNSLLEEDRNRIHLLDSHLKTDFCH
ncbi:hypothetical protein L195_g039156, partial [Trifolium pratense]